MRKILPILILGISFFVFTKNSYAQNFSTNYNVSYNVNENAVTNASFDIVLKNNTSQYYASSYKMQVGFSDLQNVKASDSEGAIKVSVEKNDKGSLLSINFNSNAVGIGNTQRFSVSFDTKQIAQNEGAVWEINIPGISKQNDFSSFNVSLTVPESLGDPVLLKPNRGKREPGAIAFTKQDLGASGISVAYGKYQVYKFNLNYHLYNKNLFPQETQMAIPSSTNYQNIKIEDISPKPKNVTIDEDGNWLASFRLLPSQNIDVKVSGKAQVFHTPKKELLPQGKRKEYLKQQKYWETNNPKIKELAKSLKTPDKIYDYVVKNLEYDFSRIKEDQVRLGAVGALQNTKSSVCLEFTDLFIAIARAAGIPAREVNGYAHTSNSSERPLSFIKDILHSWPEYYDDKKKSWVMVDPTWENTTNGVDYFNSLDFDHFSFIVRGMNSETPLPAGGYKSPGKEGVKDVLVTTAKVFNPSPTTVLATLSFPNSVIAGTPVRGKVIVENTGDVVLPSQPILVESEGLSPVNEKVLLTRIPPYGKETLQVAFHETPLLTNKKDVIKITIGKEIITKEVSISPFYKNRNFLAGGILIGSITIVISAAALRSRRLSLFG